MKNVGTEEGGSAGGGWVGAWTVSSWNISPLLPKKFGSKLALADGHADPVSPA